MKRDRYSENETILRTILRDRRLSLGYKQQELAEKLQAHQSFVSKYESGERLLTFVETVQVCQALDMDPHAVLNTYLPKHEA